MNAKRTIKPFNRITLKVISILLILSFCLAAFPQGAALAQKCKFRHKVEPGDTLIGLGLLYQIDWREIAEANDLKEPYVLTVGVKLCIPGGTKPDVVTTTTEDGVTTTTTREPIGTVIGLIKKVYVKLEFFPKNTVYYVKVQPESSLVAYRIGRIRTDNKGFAEDEFHLPWYIHQTTEMLLCIKNVWTDEVGCVIYDNPFAKAVNEKFTVPKLGR